MTVDEEYEQMRKTLALERHGHLHPEHRPTVGQRIAEGRMVAAVEAAHRLPTGQPDTGAQSRLRSVPDERTVA